MPATKQRIAVVRGTFATPGVSKNRRLYTKEHIAGAVKEAQEALANGGGLAVSMLTHHGARDARTADVTRTAGRVTKVGLAEDGSGTFEAELADTQAGRDVAALVLPDNPYLKGVSMASLWQGEMRYIPGPDGEEVETADGFSLRGIDFTHNPGVDGAELTYAHADLVEAAPSEKWIITEALDEVVFSEVEPEPETLESAAEVRAAWGALSTRSLTPAQLRRAKSKIKTAAKKFSINFAEDFALFDQYGLRTEDGPMDPDNNMDGYTQCAICTSDVPALALYCPNCGQPVPQAESSDPTLNKEGAIVPDAKNVDEGAARNLTDADLAALAALLKPVEETAEAKLVRETEEKAAADKARAEETAEAKLVREAAEKTAADAKVLEEAKAIVEAKRVADEAAAAPVTFTAEQAATMAAEAAKTAVESIRADMVKEIREQGPRRRGLVSKEVMEQTNEELYGDKPMKDVSTSDLEKMADSAFSPLISA